MSMAGEVQQHGRTGRVRGHFAFCTYTRHRLQEAHAPVQEGCIARTDVLLFWRAAERREVCGTIIPRCMRATCYLETTG